MTTFVIHWGHSGEQGEQWSTAREASRHASVVWGEVDVKDAAEAVAIVRADGVPVGDWYADGVNVHVIPPKLETYHVHSDGGSIEVYRGGRVIADNGARGDARQTLALTHRPDDPRAALPDQAPHIVLTTNGDDFCVAWIEDGRVELVDDVQADWFASFDDAPSDRAGVAAWLLAFAAPEVEPDPPSMNADDYPPSLDEQHREGHRIKRGGW